ncbi:MAG: biotin/lipoyl-binding protein [Pseudomonadota bacterium]
MFETLFCSVLTILPDYLFRRYRLGKRWGRELTLFSVWYELRWGITGCAMLTVMLFTTIFFYHPTTRAVASVFRTVTILPEAGGRVDEVLVRGNQRVAAGDVLFTLDSSQQQSAVATARARIAELEAGIEVAEADVAAAVGMTAQAEGALKDATTELARTEDLAERNANAVAQRELDRLRALVETRRGAVDAATAQRDAAEARRDVQIPAQISSARAQLAEAEVALSKTRILAGTAGVIEQFDLRPGDFVSPVLRPAGILVPDGSGHGRFFAGFGQIAAQVIKPGMIAEITCASLPFTVIPMVIVSTQDVIATGQFRPSDRLLDLGRMGQPGTITVTMEPLFEGATDAIPPGSSCMASAYSTFHDALEDPDTDFASYLFYHVVETVGVVHAAGLRIQALILPVRTLVLSGH